MCRPNPNSDTSMSVDDEGDNFAQQFVQQFALHHAARAGTAQVQQVNHIAPPPTAPPAPWPTPVAPAAVAPAAVAPAPWAVPAQGTPYVVYYSMPPGGPSAPPPPFAPFAPSTWSVFGAAPACGPAENTAPVSAAHTDAVNVDAGDVNPAPVVPDTVHAAPVVPDTVHAAPVVPGAPNASNVPFSMGVPPIPAGIPFSLSMQADTEVVPSDKATRETVVVVGDAPEFVTAETVVERMLQRTVRRCAERKAPLEPTWLVDIKEALVAVAGSVNARYAAQMYGVSEDDLKTICAKQFNVQICFPVHRHYGLMRRSCGSRHLALTPEAEEAILKKRSTEHDNAMRSNARVLVFDDTERGCEFIELRNGEYVFTLEKSTQGGHRVSKRGPTLHKAIRQRNRWFRANQHAKIVQDHITRGRTYPLLEGTRPISHISPL